MNAAKLMLSAAITSLMLFAPSTFNTAEAASIKLKPQIVKVRPKITVAQPKLRLKVRTAKIRVEPRIKIKAVTPKISAKARNKPAINQATKLAGQPKPQIMPKIASAKTPPTSAMVTPRSKPNASKFAPSMDVNKPTKTTTTASLAKHKDLTGVAEAARSVDAARIAGNASHGFSGLNTVDPKDQLVGGGSQASTGNPVGMSPDEFNTRFGDSKNVDDIAGALLGKYSNLGNRGASSPTEKWSNEFRPSTSEIPVTNIAAGDPTQQVTEFHGGAVHEVKTVDNYGNITVETTTTSGSGTADDPMVVEQTTVETHNNEPVRTETILNSPDGFAIRLYESYETGTGRIYGSDSGGHEWQDRVKDLTRTKTGDEHADAAPPPNCGSANCISRRNGYSLRKKAKGGTHADPGPDGALPATEATNVMHFINRDDLVKNGIAETGIFAGFGGAYGRLKNGGVRY